MKKQLFTALLAFTAILCFAKQPTNAELLAHLKNVETEISNILNETEIEINRADNELTNKFLFLSNIAHEILAVSELWKQELLIKQQCYYNAICNNLKTYTDIIDIVSVDIQSYKMQSIMSAWNEKSGSDSYDHIIDSIPANIRELHQLNKNISITDLFSLLDKLYSNNALIEKHDQLVKSIYTKH